MQIWVSPMLVTLVFLSLCESCQDVIQGLVFLVFSVPLPLMLFLSPFLCSSLSSERKDLVETAHSGLCVPRSLCLHNVHLWVSYLFPSVVGRSFSDFGSIRHWSKIQQNSIWGHFIITFFPSSSSFCLRSLVCLVSDSWSLNKCSIWFLSHVCTLSQIRPWLIGSIIFVLPLS